MSRLSIVAVVDELVRKIEDTGYENDEVLREVEKQLRFIAHAIEITNSQTPFTSATKSLVGVMNDSAWPQASHMSDSGITRP